MPLGFMTNKFQLLYCIVSEFPTVVSAGYSTLLDHAWRRDLFVQLWRERENLWREWKSENTGMVASRLPPLRGCVSWGKASPSKPSGEGEPSSEETLHWSSRGSTRSTAGQRGSLSWKWRPVLHQAKMLPFPEVYLPLPVSADSHFPALVPISVWLPKALGQLSVLAEK